MKSFTEKVLDIVSQIKSGEILTYKQVAILANSKDASRAVGTIMAQNDDKNIPCHRVVRSDGGVGDYNGLRGKDKATLLKEEGVLFFKNGKIKI